MSGKKGGRKTAGEKRGWGVTQGGGRREEGGRRHSHGNPCMVHAPDSAVVSLVSVVLFSHGLQPRCVDHKQMLMTFLTAVSAQSHQCS